MSTVKDRVKQIIVEQLGVDEDSITDETSFVDGMGADSLDTVEIVMALEEEFGCEISDDEAENLTTVTKVIEYIEIHSDSGSDQ